MKPEDRLEAAKKQLRIAGNHDHVTESQSNAIDGVITVVEELAYSVQAVREDNLIPDGNGQSHSKIQAGADDD